jgi:hypothetical protein
MMLTQVKKHNGIVFYGYTYGTNPTPYWSMKYYEETCPSPAQANERVYQIRSHDFHPPIPVFLP